MGRNINVAVLGLGRLGSIHVENLLHRIYGADLICLADPFGDHAEKTAKKLGVAKWTANPIDVFKDDEIDAVVIATPTSTHAEMVKLAATHKKHIFIEKPITQTLDEANECIDLIQENGVLCQVGFMRRFHPTFVQAKKRIEAGEIGKPIHFKGYTRDNPAGKYSISPQIEFLKKSGGIFLDLAIHDYDIARYLMGSEVSSVLATGSIVAHSFMTEYNDVDQAITFLQFESGATGDIESSRNSPYGFDIACEIIGTEGAISIPTIRTQEITILNEQGKHELSPNFPPSLQDAFLTEVQSFIDCIQNQTASFCNEGDGKEALKIAIAATESYQQKKAILLADYK